jgi:hypothetical protein
MRTFIALSTLTAVLAAGPVAVAGPQIGQPAPAFTARDADGAPVSLAQYRGRPVVLEWTNNGCPFVGHVYRSGVMQGLQKRAAADGFTWLTVISSAPGRQGYLTGPEAKAWKKQTGAAPADVVLDPQGLVGRAYDARTTPDMYVIDARGVLVYAGGIDDRESTRDEDATTARNYVALAMADLKAGRPIADPVTKPYGCSVKYSGG